MCINSFFVVFSFQTKEQSSCWIYIVGASWKQLKQFKLNEEPPRLKQTTTPSSQWFQAGYGPADPNLELGMYGREV